MNRVEAWAITIALAIIMLAIPAAVYRALFWGGIFLLVAVLWIF